MKTIFVDTQPNGALAPKQSRWKELWFLFRQNRLSILGLIMFVLFFIVALTGLFLTSGQDPLFDPAQVRLQEKLRPPISAPNLETRNSANVPTLGVFILGTDNLGRDVFSRMLQGAWVSLTVGFVAVGISVLIGIFMGGVAGYFGQHHINWYQVLVVFAITSGAVLFSAGFVYSGAVVLLTGHLLLFSFFLIKKMWGEQNRPKWFHMLLKGAVSVDTLIMRVVDIMLCFPTFFLILTVVALLPASIYNIMIVIGLTSWTGTTRFVRAEFLSLREQDFVTAARALGVGNLRIIFRHMMPNAIAPVLVSATIGIASAILTEAALSFLGFGVPPPHATWGNILSEGKRFIFDAPWLTFIPGISILIVVLSFNLFGEGLRDVLNPKLRERQ